MDFIYALLPPTTLWGQMNPNFIPFWGLKSMLAFPLRTIRQTKWHNSEKSPLAKIFLSRGVRHGSIPGREQLGLRSFLPPENGIHHLLSQFVRKQMDCGRVAFRYPFIQVWAPHCLFHWMCCVQALISSF